MLPYVSHTNKSSSVFGTVYLTKDHSGICGDFVPVRI